MYVARQLEETLEEVRVQLEDGVKVPDALLPKLTDPEGGVGVPASTVSVTVAVQEVPRLTTTGFGKQLTLVEVGRRLTITVSVPELPEWTVSPL